jgi:hypothetical protein
VSLWAPGWVSVQTQAFVGTSYAAALAAALALEVVRADETVDLPQEMRRGASFRSRARVRARNTTNLIATAAPYPWPTTGFECAAADADAVKWRWWFPFSFSPSLTFSFSFEAASYVLIVQLPDGRNVSVRTDNATHTLRVDDETTQDVDADHRRVVAFTRTAMLVCSPRAFVARLNFSFADESVDAPTARVRIAFEDCSGPYVNISLARSENGETPIQPVMPPCAQRPNATSCVARPASPADTLCVWMGPQMGCIRADYCGFQRRSLCERRSPTCAWQTRRGACVRSG